MKLKRGYGVEKGGEVSMPKANIGRAIKRGPGDLEGITYEEITYEGFGSGGVAVLVDVLTDNRNRTAGEVRKIFERNGGNMGSAGCVGYLFERKGTFLVAPGGKDEDTILRPALDAGAAGM